jgi:hypothetical protein
MMFDNMIQTYGTLLPDESCEFLNESNFLVEISIEGAEPLHDVHRFTKKGRGTFHKVKRCGQVDTPIHVRAETATRTKRCHGARQPTAHEYREVAGGPGWPRPRVRDRHEQQGEPSCRTVRTF